MKKIIAMAVATAAVSFGFTAEKVETEKPLKVLMIGNSFSICNHRQMPQVA